MRDKYYGYRHSLRQYAAILYRTYPKPNPNPNPNQVLEAARQAESVLYLSCNPHTLARDLTALGTTHHVTDAALFDQFPHTPHAEVGVMLQRRGLATRPRVTRGTGTGAGGLVHRPK